MKKNTAFAKISFFLICLIILFVAGCSEDSVITPELESGEAFLNYDGDNLSSPNLEADTYEAAARFTAAATGNAANARLLEVYYYVVQMPATCRVKVYGPNSAGEPGELLYNADVLSNTSSQGWNVHELSSPLTLSGDDLWISIEFSHSDTRAVLGCDPGPAAMDGDWLFANSDNNWIPLNTRTNIDINWNIRGVVELP